MPVTRHISELSLIAQISLVGRTLLSEHRKAVSRS